MNNFTEAQRKVINMIETNLNIRFKGTTKKEARDFISNNIEKSKIVSNEYIKEIKLLRLEDLENEFETENNYFENGWHNMPH
jgi:mannitol/fructose-specific phosphotransferase system IIA component (Ntr-type)